MAGVDTREVLYGLINSIRNLIDNVWRMKLHIKIQKLDHMDGENEYLGRIFYTSGAD
jgi:hypothetical protein|tara:strand:- start:30 stop:200 length:171 start_codon:yes stop_codon:yes gene_type:complete